MGVDKFNHEGYFDPTTYEALTNIHREEMAADKKAAYLPLVYVCSPYAGDVETKVIADNYKIDPPQKVRDAIEHYKESKELVDFLNGAEPFTEWDDSLFERFVEKVKVLSRDEVEFELKFGLRLKERID